MSDLRQTQNNFSNAPKATSVQVIFIFFDGNFREDEKFIARDNILFRCMKHCDAVSPRTCTNTRQSGKISRYFAKNNSNNRNVRSFSRRTHTQRRIFVHDRKTILAEINLISFYHYQTEFYHLVSKHKLNFIAVFSFPFRRSYRAYFTEFI